MRDSLVRWIVSRLRPYRARLAWLAVVSVVEVGLGLFTPWPLKFVVDNVLAGHPLPPSLDSLLSGAAASPASLLLLILAGGLALQISSQFVSMLHTHIQVDTGQRMVYDLRNELFAHLQALEMRHHTGVGAGDAVYRLEADAYCIENLVMTGLFPIASAALTLAVMVIILVRLDAALALLALAVVPFMYLCLRFYSRTLSVRAERVKEIESNLIERLYETFAAIRVVKSFARERHELDRFSARSCEAMTSRVRLTWQESLFSVAVSSLTIIGTTLVLATGGMHVLSGRLTLGALLVVIAYLASVYGPLSAIAHTAGSLQQAVASARRVRRTLALRREMPAGRPATAIRGAIRFEHVSFSYAGQPVLTDVSFEARPGEMVAIVGLTGAGKSTLVSMIPRLYEPDAGRVLIDGVDARTFDLASLREHIAVVLQDALLFRGTIMENIRYGRTDASDDDVRTAAAAAHAHEFVMRAAEGYAAAVGEAGNGLSGGERQRLSIARALLKDAPILILDEPTSSLDSISEGLVFSALRGVRAGRTTIVIAHRLSTIRDADRILVLDRGRIAASGTHDEILQASDLYRRMWSRLTVGRSLDEPLTVDELAEQADRAEDLAQSTRSTRSTRFADLALSASSARDHSARDRRAP